MIRMYKIAVLGERDIVIGFSALGLSVFPVSDETEAVTEFKKLTSNGEFAIIYVTETYFTALEAEADKFKESVTPAVIFIPGAGGSKGLASSALNASVERAVGASIL